MFNDYFSYHKIRLTASCAKNLEDNEKRVIKKLQWIEDDGYVCRKYKFVIKCWLCVKSNMTTFISSYAKKKV